MLIANPLYDVVFKYMMEDNKVAKKFISAIIGEQVKELQFAPQEYVAQIELRQQTHTVCRLDFIARVITADGERRSVMIEVQKANISTDIMRFRQYLGKQYQNLENSHTDKRGKINAMQIYCIFVLGDGLKIPGVPVLEIIPEVKDRATGKPLTNITNIKQRFIKSLHHRSWIVQVPELPKHRRDDLEKMLSIFNQNHRTSRYILNIPEEEVPPQYRDIVRRLQKAAGTSTMQANMEAEDFLLEAFRLQERQAQMQIEKKEKAMKKKDKALEEKEKIIDEKEKIIDEKEKIIDAKEKVIDEKEKVIDEKEKVIDEKEKTLDEKEKALEESKKIIEDLRRQLKENNPDKA